MKSKPAATYEDLHRVPGKAELVNGKIVHMPPSGAAPGAAASEITFALMKYVESTGVGRATGETVAFKVNLPNRQSFSPDAAYYTGPRAGMDFFPQAPVFAAEVRSKGDYGPRAEREMADKRADTSPPGRRSCGTWTCWTRRW